MSSLSAQTCTLLLGWTLISLVHGGEVHMWAFQCRWLCGRDGSPAQVQLWLTKRGAGWRWKVGGLGSSVVPVLPW